MYFVCTLISIALTFIADVFGWNWSQEVYLLSVVESLQHRTKSHLTTVKEV
jgi:hypothetical protein